MVFGSCDGLKICIFAIYIKFIVLKVKLNILFGKLKQVK